MSLVREQWSLCGSRGAQGWAPEQVPLELHWGRQRTWLLPWELLGWPLLISLPPKWGVFIFHVENTGTSEKTRQSPLSLHLASERLPSFLFFPFLSQTNTSLCRFALKKWTGPHGSSWF